MLPISVSKAQKMLAQNMRERRLQLDFTQEGLSKRAGVPLPTLRKFEQKGLISLESFLKLQMVLGSLEHIIELTKVKELPFTSIDDVLDDVRSSASTKQRQRGKRK